MRPIRCRTSLLLLAGFALAIGACGGGGSKKIPLPESSPFPPDMEARLHGIRDKTLEVRELFVSPDVDEGMLTRDQLRAYFDEVEAASEDESRSEIDLYNKVWRLMHMLGPDDDLLAISTESDSEDILGFFDDESRELVLVADTPELDQDDEFILSHEYVHAFQHEAFDRERLDKFAEDEEDEDPTEYGTTVSCLTEGDASLASVLYASEVFGPEWFDDEGIDDGSDEPEASLPAAYERYSAFNYNECVTWAVRLFVDHGRSWRKINDAYENPPSTTEQILHPEKFLAGEGPTSMAPINLSKRLGKGWEREGGVFGEFDVYNYLLTVLEDEPLAALGSGGWGVGWGWLYSREAKEGEEAPVLLHIALEFDSELESAEFGATYRAAIQKLAGGQERVSASGNTACWTGVPELGYHYVDAARARHDIILSTDADALTTAISDSLSTAGNEPCP